MSNNRVWIDVPHEATIFMGLEVPPDKIVSGHVDCASAAGPLPPITHAEVTPGPAGRPMTSPPTHYTYKVRITFGSNCTATFRARVEKPDKSTHGDLFVFAVRGDEGEVKLATLVCVMEQAS